MSGRRLSPWGETTVSSLTEYGDDTAMTPAIRVTRLLPLFLLLLTSKRKCGDARASSGDEIYRN